MLGKLGKKLSSIPSVSRLHLNCFPSTSNCGSKRLGLTVIGVIYVIHMSIFMNYWQQHMCSLGRVASGLPGMTAYRFIT